ncbi:MAG: YiiD C-terminal domain-containing protein [Opitutae bacterium]|nr:YiiD C-terminal domain-containing protein [Opitutae bacterium]
MDVTSLPFNHFIGIAHAPQPDGRLSLPGDPRYTNHLGTVHASALFALAEAASGDCLAREFSDLGIAVIPVVRRVEAKFRKPAVGAIFAQASITAEKKAEFVATLTGKGRALLEIAVEIQDEKGTSALTATVEWFVARKD